MSRQQRIMITGASGFTGIHACEHFLNKGYQVIGVVRRKTLSFEHQGMLIEKCDLTNKQGVDALIHKTKPHFLLHLAGQNHVPTSWKEPLATFENNVVSTAYLIESIRVHFPFCKIIVVGSALQSDLNQISTPTHPYSFSKSIQVLAAQAWQTLFHMNIMIAKPSNLIGPGPSKGVCSILAEKIAKMEFCDVSKFLEVSNLLAKRDFLDVRDAVLAYDYMFAKGEAGKIYDVCSGNPRTLKEIINVFHSMATVNFQFKGLQDENEKLESIKPLELQNIGWSQKIQLKQSLNDILTEKRNIVSSLPS
ncbi:NAD-dependent epimerase/dehydratase family protein [Cytobacillus sp. Hz8]|uniref:NAD-dependent epimerase/dehydratase family protein n=1 Tax=Cytobacillus sp. Hz8 TaxID=3347168 RepID=UPI0035DC764F